MSESRSRHALEDPEIGAELEARFGLGSGQETLAQHLHLGQRIRGWRQRDGVVLAAQFIAEGETVVERRSRLLAVFTYIDQLKEEAAANNGWHLLRGLRVRGVAVLCRRMLKEQLEELGGDSLFR